MEITPQDAAGLVLLRGVGEELQVLLGRRHRNMVFMPGYYVFPGGRLEEQDLGDDAEIFFSVEGRLDSKTQGLLPALCRAALRELTEETGLSFSPLAESPMRLLARAITPPGNPRRFDTRFFLGDGTLAAGSLGGNGELENVGWVGVSDLEGLPVARITQAVLRQALLTWRDPATPYRHLTGAKTLG
jgi:8-oxo-dGTP pyrophosphatase MutT (NUDIX family)